MNVYLHAFKFREPFQTIIDDEIILHCEKSSFDLIKGLKRTIQSEIKPMITQCCMQSLYKTNNQTAIDIGKSFERRRCNHPPSDPLAPKDCIKSIIAPDNKHRYVLASQIFELRKELMNVPGVPMVFMNRSVMVMEPISKMTLRYANDYENKKLTGGLNSTGQEPVKQEPAKKRKGPKQPNPLSIKKKKVEKTDENKENRDNDDTGEVKEKKIRRKRKHTRKTDHPDGETTAEKEQDVEQNADEES